MSQVQRYLPKPMVRRTDLLALQKFKHLAQWHAVGIGSVQQWTLKRDRSK